MMSDCFDSLCDTFSYIFVNNTDIYQSLATDNLAHIYNVMVSNYIDAVEKVNECKNSIIGSPIKEYLSRHISSYKCFLYYYFLKVFSVDLLAILNTIDDTHESAELDSICLLMSDLDPFNELVAKSDRSYASLTIPSNINLPAESKGSQISLSYLRFLTIDNKNAPFIDVKNLEKITFTQTLDYLPNIFSYNLYPARKRKEAGNLIIDFTGHTPKSVDPAFYAQFRSIFRNIDFNYLDTQQEKTMDKFLTNLDSFKKKYNI